MRQEQHFTLLLLLSLLKRPMLRPSIVVFRVAGRTNQSRRCEIATANFPRWVAVCVLSLGFIAVVAIIIGIVWLLFHAATFWF
jgi:hypothetical protein